MRNRHVICLATLIAPPTLAGDSDYDRWCARRADSEQVPAEEREDYIGACVDALTQADRNPSQSQGKGKSRDDEG